MVGYQHLEQNEVEESSNTSIHANTISMNTFICDKTNTHNLTEVELRSSAGETWLTIIVTKVLLLSVLSMSTGEFFDTSSYSWNRRKFSC